MPWVAIGCRLERMVRRGSPVRVRKRALKDLQTAVSCCLRWLASREGVGAVRRSRSFAGLSRSNLFRVMLQDTARSHQGRPHSHIMQLGLASATDCRCEHAGPSRDRPIAARQDLSRLRLAAVQPCAQVPTDRRLDAIADLERLLMVQVTGCDDRIAASQFIAITDPSHRDQDDMPA